MSSRVSHFKEAGGRVPGSAQRKPVPGSSDLPFRKVAQRMAQDAESSHSMKWIRGPCIDFDS